MSAVPSAISSVVASGEATAINAIGPVAESAADKVLAKVTSDPTTLSDVNAFVLLGLKIGGELLSPLATKGLVALAGKFGITIA